MNQISKTDLILNPDGSVYHLNLLPEDIGDAIITVGDPGRVEEVSDFFDKVELKKGKREFLTHTGYIGKKRISVVSTGIGTDNIDIVINELDALVNIDLTSRRIKAKKKVLDIVRVGTSGTLQDDIPVNSIVVSEYAIGFDSLMHHYLRDLSDNEINLRDAINKELIDFNHLVPYVAEANTELFSRANTNSLSGITLTAPGFYAPQGRNLRAKKAFPSMFEKLAGFNFNGKRITNLEMETAGIYGLAKVLGHKALSVSAILANRKKGEFSSDPRKVIMSAIVMAIKKII